MTASEIFAIRLKELRTEKELSLEKLSDLTGIGKTSLCYYENLKRDPTLSVVKNLAEYFEVDVSYLVGETNRRDYKKTPNDEISRTMGKRVRDNISKNEVG